MDGIKPNANIENDEENKNKKNQPDLSELSGPIMFARADDILFASAMEDENFFGAEIEIGEKVLNSSNINNDSKPVLEKPTEIIEQKETKKDDNTDNSLVENNKEIPIEIPIDIKSYVSEEIFEFDISDPITEPTAVIGGEEESFDEEILTEEVTSENTNTEKSVAIEIPKIAVAKPMVEINIEEPAVLQEPVNPETPEPLITVPSITWKHVEGEEPYSPSKEINLEKCFHSEDMEENEDASYLDITTNPSNSINLDKIKEIVLEGKDLNVEVDVSHEHIILINNSQEFLKYQHNIMDNRCISFFWPCNENGVIGSRISVTTEKEKTFIIDLDKIDINLMNLLLKTQRPIKIFYNAKPVIIWCLKNNLKISHIFDISTALNILSDGITVDNSLESILKRFANHEINPEDISFQDFIFIGKFVFIFRKKLVDFMQEFNLIKVLNFEQNLLFAIAQSESDGMPYNQNCSKPMSQNVWELVESKYGVSSKKELANRGILFFNKDYLTDKKNLLEVYEYASLESAERTLKNFDPKYAREDRIYSNLTSCPSGGIVAKDYSFDGEGLYPFISPNKDNCLVEGAYKNLEIRVVAKLLNNRKLINSFNTENGPFSYFAGPLFDKSPEDVTVDEKFITKMIFEIVIRNLGERETLNHAWNISKSFLKKEEEIFSLKEKFKKVHPDLTNLIKDTQKLAKKDGYVSSSMGRITVVNNSNKAFFTKVEMYMNEIFKRALSLSFTDFDAYNAEFSNKIKLCTIYNRIITLECNKKIVNIAIDMLTRNMTITASKMLGGIPVLLKVYAVEQWEC